VEADRTGRGNRGKRVQEGKHDGYALQAPVVTQGALGGRENLGAKHPPVRRAGRRQGSGGREVRCCRYWRCKRPFWPEKRHYYYCSWDCRVADVGVDYARDYRGYQRDHDTHYDGGFWDGARVRPADVDIPPRHLEGPGVALSSG
jgi:hypothetical protein